jgi:hypothetical protein
MAEFSYTSKWVEICNRSLALLGGGSIQALDEGSSLSNYCQTFLPDSIEDILGQYPWNCSRERVQLAQDLTAPAYGFDHAYRLPVDYINLVHVECDDEPYQIEFPYILTDADEVFITYIKRPTDPNNLTAAIRKAISAALARFLVIPLSSNENIAARIESTYMSAVDRAKADDLQGAEETVGEDWYDEAR